MADERVVIRIDIDSDTREITKVQAQLAALASQGEAVQRSVGKTENQFKGLNSSSERLTKTLDGTTDSMLKHDNAHRMLSGGSGGGSIGRTNREMGRSGGGARRTHREFRRLLYGLIAVGIEFAVVAASLSLVNAGFAIGRFAAKTYQAALAGAAVAVAGITIALAGAAAAQREYQAAVFATTYKSLPGLGNGTQQAMSALRMLTADQRVAVFGFESLQQAFAAVSKSTEMTAPLKNALVGIGDFAVAAGGDIGKNFAAAGDFIGLLQKEGKLTESVLASASKVGPQFEKAVKDAQKTGITGSQDLLKALSSGQLAEQAGIGGALGAVNNTLIGQLKSFMSLARSEFADYGQIFLPQLKQTFKGLSHELTIGFSRIRAAIGPTMGGELIDTTGRGVGRLIELFVRLFEDNLPKARDTFKEIYGFLRRSVDFIRRIDDIFRPFQEGSRIINQTFGPPIMALIMHFVDAFKQLNRLAVENEDAFLRFGDNLKRTVELISDGFDVIKEVFVNNLDAINVAFESVLNVAELLMGVVKGLATAGRELGPLGNIMSLAMGLTMFGGFQMLGNVRRGRRGIAPKGTIFSGAANLLNRGYYGPYVAPFGRPSSAGGRGLDLGKQARMLPQAPGFAGMVGLLGQLPIMGQAPSWAGTAGMLGGTAALLTSNRQRSAQLAAVSLAIPYLATAARAQTALGGLTSGMIGGGGLGFGIGSLLNGRALPFSGINFKGPLTKGPGFTGPGGSAGATNMAARGLGSGLLIGGAMGLTRGAVQQFDLSAQGAAPVGLLAGAAAGAGTGALLSSPTGPGALIGAAIGAIAGAIYGVTLGIINDREQRDTIRKGVAKLGIDQAKALAGDFLKDGVPGVVRGIRSIQDSTFEIDRIAAAYREKTLGERKDMAEAAILRGEITQEQYDILTLRNMDTAIKQLKKNSDELVEYALRAYRNVDSNLTRLSAASNMSRDAIGKLAKEMNVDLTDNTLRMSEALRQLGLAIPATTEEIRKSVKRVSLDALGDLLRPIIEAEEAILAMDQAAEEIRTAGGFTGGRSEMAKFIQTVFTGQMARFENPYEAFAALQRGFGGPQGTVFTDPTSSLFGMYTPEFGKEVEDALRVMRQSMFTTLGGTVATGLTGLPGSNFVFDATQFSAMFEGITTSLPETMRGMGIQFAGKLSELFADRLRNPEFRSRYEALGRIEDPVERARAQANMTGDLINAIGNELTGEGGPFSALRDLVMRPEGGLIGITSQFDQAANRVADEVSKMREGVRSGITDAFGSEATKPMWWTLPPWWNPPGGDTAAPKRWLTKAAGLTTGTFSAGGSSGSMSSVSTYGSSYSDQLLGINDTTSSRLGQTLSRHNYFNSMLPGKRMITSSWRNTGLGSLNSDHVTGHAYDLVGQNLVGYAAAVNGAGGFAEFHGSGSDRHLHVVPGATPYGDAVSPMGSTATMASGSYNANYSIVVNASPNQDVSAIANEVMNRIEDKERQIRERS